MENNQLIQLSIRKKSIALCRCLSQFGIALYIIVSFGCAVAKEERMKIPGNPILNDYGITFKIDWDIFESGTYIYSPKDEIEDLPSLMGGGGSGYARFYTLILDFKFKDGREFHEEINLELLILEMVQKHNIFDLKTTKWGGFAEVNIRVKSDRLILDYNLSEMVKKEYPEMVLYKEHYYPIFEKKLD